MSTTPTNADIRLVTGNSLLERNLLSSYERISRLNEDLGEEEIIFKTTQTDIIARYEHLIELRVISDLRRFGRQPDRRAQAIYALFGERPEHYVIFVVPIHEGDVDGAYAPSPGLIYRARKDRPEILSVSPDNY